MFPIWWLENGHTAGKGSKVYVLELFGFQGTEKQNSNYYTYVVRVVLFNGNNIHIARCRRHTGNKYGGQKSESSFSLAGVAHIPTM